MKNIFYKEREALTSLSPLGAFYDLIDYIRIHGRTRHMYVYRHLEECH